MACLNLQDTHREFFTICSLKELHENVIVKNQNVNFIKETRFYKQV